MSARQSWNPELYEARHAFVWQLGAGVIELLEPKAGERILDLGCGTGQLTERIAQGGAQVTGLDASAEMIGQARQNYPKLEFVLDDAAKMRYEGEFDAVFSNAALHWMPDAEAVARAIARALKPGGRLVAEFGGKGNIAQIEQALDAVLAAFGATRSEKRNYFPSIAEYAAVLERAGLETRMAQLFERPTPLEGEAGMANWLRQFRGHTLEAIEPARREAALAEVVARLRPVLHGESGWYADYRRLRVIAVKV
ncbi:MAG TPA: methyltransferase domain-containing protein [Bryobacteraceae bacterium]|jgi:trans-aconitate methyltransferase|nr:methyltransferase domain-containing protein [Bryobacteraceae bacterium]